MFPSNSAFTKSAETNEYLEGIRRKALEQVEQLPDDRKQQLEALAKQAQELLENVQNRPSDK